MSENVPSKSQLRQIWDNFFRSQTGTYEKSLWLDLLLAEFLVQLKDGLDVTSIDKFCPIGGVVTLIGCELLCGIHCASSTYGRFVTRSDRRVRFQDTEENQETQISPRVVQNNPESLSDNITPINERSQNNISEPVLEQALNTLAINQSNQYLRKYALNGPAWRCLALLEITGVKGLSCSRQLSGVLIWLYGELNWATMASQGCNPYLPQFQEKPPIYELLSNKIWTNKKHKTVLRSKSKSNNNSKEAVDVEHKKIESPREKHSKRIRKKHDSVDTNLHKTENTADDKINSSDSLHEDDLERMNRSFNLRVRYNPYDFEYFTTGVRSEEMPTSNEFQRRPLVQTPERQKPSVKDFTSVRHEEVLNSEISLYEFNTLVIHLLHQLCKTENDAGSDALHISVHCVNFALQNLSILQFGSSAAVNNNFNSIQINRLKVSLTELLIVSLNKVLMHSDLFVKLINNGVLPSLLRLLDDVTYKLSVNLKSREVNNASSIPSTSRDYQHHSLSTNAECEDSLKYLFGLNYCILTTLFCFLSQHQSVDFNEQFKLLEDSRRGLLLKDSICVMVRIPVDNKKDVTHLVKTLIDLIGRLIIAMKQTRGELSHLATCSRAKHKKCYPKVLLTLHHHKNILGTHQSPSNDMILSAACCVSTLFGIFSSLLDDEYFTSDAVLRIKILRKMKSCGSCCCFSPQNLIEKAIKLIYVHQNVANICFSMLERTLYEELGATNVYYENGSSNCAICNRYFIMDASAVSSAINQSCMSKEYQISKENFSEYLERRTCWPFLAKYNLLLQSENPSLLHGTMSHLLRMSSICNTNIRHDLLFCVVYPAFMAAKMRYIVTNAVSSFFVISSCLNLFSNLLCSVSFTEEFIQRGGLANVLELMTSPEFSRPCCSVLEIAVDVEILKMHHELFSNNNNENKMLHDIESNEIQSLVSLQMLFKSLNESTERLFSYFKLKMDMTVFSNVIDLRNDKNYLVISKNSKKDLSSSLSKKSENSTPQNITMSEPINIVSSKSQDCVLHEMQFASTENIIDNHLELLKNASTFWKTSASLCLYCPLLRKYFVTHEIFEDLFKLIKLILYNMMYVPSSLTESSLLAKILESTVTIGLAVSDCTMDNSRSLTVKLLSETFLSDMFSSIECSNMKSLLELLMKISTVYASEIQVLPPVNKSKLPPLQFSSHCHDDISSGEEDESKYLLYLSEDSEHYQTADEGYEADEEIGAIDSVDVNNKSKSEYVFKNQSLQMELGSDNLEQTNLNESSKIECPFYKKNQLMMFPDICTMIVDILMNLIQKIINEYKKAGDGDLNESLSPMFSTVCSSLGRLSTILSADVNYSSESGIIFKILSSTAVDILKINNNKLLDLQNSVSNLIYILANHSISAAELRLYINLFTSPNVTLNVILGPLCRLAENIDQNVPDFILCFPTERFSIKDEVLKKSKPAQFDQLPKLLQSHHEKAEIESCWSKAGVYCGIDGVSWGLWVQGCSITMWLRIQELSTQKVTDLHQFSSSDGSGSENILEWTINNRKISKLRNNFEASSSTTNKKAILHMLSVGHDSLMIEFWIETNNGDLIVKIARPDYESNKIIGEGKISNCLSLNRWNHLAMNIREIMQKRKICIEVTLFINGYKENVLVIPINGILFRKPKPGYLLLGHSALNENETVQLSGSFYLSGVTLYRTPILDIYNVMYLYANGPNYSGLSNCLVENRLPNFTTLFTDPFLTSNINWDQVLEPSSVNIQELQDNLLLNFSAQNPLAVELYHQTIPNPTVFVGRASGKAQRNGCRIPGSIPAMWLGLPLPSHYRGLPPAAYIVGGPQVFLYLFARVVELDGSPEEQADALKLLFNVSFSDARLYSMFHQDDLYSMLEYIFASPKFEMTLPVIQVILNTACSTNILTNNNSIFQLEAKSEAVIIHPQLLVTLLRVWKELEGPNITVSKSKVITNEEANNDYNTEDENKEHGNIWLKSNHDMKRCDILSNESSNLLETVFMSMEIMLRDEHPFRSFNFYQMNRVNMVQSLLLFCKERFLNSEMKRLSDTSSFILVELIRSLMGSPPLVHHIALLADFLVLMHKASATFITHGRSNFYFLLTTAVQSQTGKISNILGLPLQFSNKKKRKRNTRKKRENTSINNSYNQRITMSPTENSNGDNEVLPFENDLESLNVGSKKMEESYEMITNDIMNFDNVNIDLNKLPPSSSSADLVKQSKALINMRIKQNNLKKEKRKRKRTRCRKQGLNKHFEEIDEIGSNEMDILQDLKKDLRALQSSPLNTSVISKEYVVIESDEVDRPFIENNSIALYQEVKSPTLLHNLRAGSIQSWTICEGLLLLLRDTLCIMPDTLLNQVLGVVLHSETFLILGNHREANVRAGVVKVICALTQRCSPEDLKNLEISHYFFHLANQISQYPASQDLVSACASLITDSRASLKDQLGVETWSDISKNAISRSPPLFAMLPCTLHDIPLAHDTILLLQKVVEKGNVKSLCDSGLSEVVLKSLEKIAFFDDKVIDKYKHTIDDLRRLLIQINLKSVMCQNNLQTTTDIYHLLSFLELKERAKSHDKVTHCSLVKIMRDTQCYLLDSELDFLEKKLTDLNKPATSNFSMKVLSPGMSGNSDTEINSWYEPLGALMKLPQQKYGKLTRSEVQSKQYSLLSKSSVFITSRDTNLEASTIELHFTKRVFLTLINIISGINQQLRPKWWHNFGNNDFVRILNEIFTWIISPLSSSISLKRISIRNIFGEIAALQQMLTPSDPIDQRKLAVYLTIAIDNFYNEPDDELLKSYVLKWISNLQPVHGQPLTSQALIEESQHLITVDKEENQHIHMKLYPAINKSVFNKEWLANKLTETAMSVTRLIVETQNSERKAFMDYLRQQQSAFVINTQKWQNLIETFTHEKGLMFSEKSYPKSWEIDPTEGPDRVRVRLRRCHLNVDERFFKDEFKYKSKSAMAPDPLSYLFDSFQDSMQGSLSERLHMNESVRHMTRAVYVTVKCEQRGELLLSDRCLHFLPDANERQQSYIGAYWSLDSIVKIVTRRWQLRERAVELFLSSGHAHLIAFENTNEMESFLGALDNCYLPNRFEFDSLSESMNFWRNGAITNWKYLMQLNGWAGRSYNDLMQYPVLPFILADYTSLKLDLKRPNSFRDLRKPMAVQDRRNETHYINNYNYLKEARMDGSNLMNGVNYEPYHYGSHYSNSGTVLHFLVRLPPFTKLFLCYQDNNFDIPDRTFHSLQTTWRLTSCDSTTDVKELIPEFFYLPQILSNSEGLNFGFRQCGDAVDDVLLPPWANNARLFTLIHRQALESAYVRENLPNWIDLVFGYKQTGQAAVDAVNVFHPATYYGFNPSCIIDELEKHAWETMVRTYGQTPRQLLKSPHPHCITDLGHIPESTLEVLPNVIGLRWGKYCGSPQEPIPNIVWSRHHTVPIRRLIPLLTNEVIGVPSHSTLMITYSKNKINSANGNVIIGTNGLITWGHPDGIIRIKQRKDVPPEPLMKIDSIDPLCIVSHGTGESTGSLWLGLQSGRIIVLSPAPVNSTPPMINFARRTINLYGHSTSIVSIYVCGSFGVAASASQDGAVIIWDTHSYSYVRSLPINEPSISEICISETMCDVASVHIFIYSRPPSVSSTQSNIEANKERKENGDRLLHQNNSKKQENSNINANDNRNIDDNNQIQPKIQMKYRSKIKVHTINGIFVGEVKIGERVTSICYSNATEGISVNAIAVGLQSGCIRLFSSWDLKSLVCLTPTTFTHPIISLVYSQDSHYLFAAAADGTVMVWEGANNSEKMPNFRVVTSLAIL